MHYGCLTVYSCLILHVYTNIPILMRTWPLWSQRCWIKSFVVEKALCFQINGSDPPHRFRGRGIGLSVHGAINAASIQSLRPCGCTVSLWSSQPIVAVFSSHQPVLMRGCMSHVRVWMNIAVVFFWCIHPSIHPVWILGCFHDSAPCFLGSGSSNILKGCHEATVKCVCKAKKRCQGYCSNYSADLL